MRGRLFLSALAAGVIGAALTVAGVRSPVTGPLTLLFLLLTPAVCVALLLAGLDPLARAIVAGAAALALATAIAEVMLVASAWSPRAGVIVVGIACGVLALTAAVRRRRANSGGDEASGATAPDDDEDAWAFEA
jgi:peptidoglycan/LPS O-acetylase OafA/YrhL